MSSASNIRLDDLEKTIKALLSEKNGLENKLKKVKEQKNGVQKAVDKTKSKCSHIKNIGLQLKETLKVAQHKYSETQVSLDKITDDVRKMKMEIENMSKKNDAEREKDLENVQQYEESLKEITNQLNQAKGYFSEKSLKNECLKETVNGKRQYRLVEHYESCLTDIEEEMQTEGEESDTSIAETFCTQVILDSIKQLANEDINNLDIAGIDLNKDGQEAKTTN